MRLCTVPIVFCGNAGDFGYAMVVDSLYIIVGVDIGCMEESIFSSNHTLLRNQNPPQRFCRRNYRYSEHEQPEKCQRNRAHFEGCRVVFSRDAIQNQ